LITNDRDPVALVIRPKLVELMFRLGIPKLGWFGLLPWTFAPVHRNWDL